MLKIAHCNSCGKIHQHNIRNLCASCSLQLDQAWDACMHALYSNRKLTVGQLSTLTGTQESSIHSFMKTGKISMREFPNLNYPCESCCSPIRENRLCYSCRCMVREGLADLLKPAEKEKTIIFQSRRSLA